MLERPFYQASIAFLTVLTLVGGVAVLLSGGGRPGIEIVPAPHEVEVSAAGDTSPGASSLVNINTASANQLDESLPGIGPVLSERIIAFRDQNGPFVRTDQLMLVSGIGETTYQRLRDLVTVGE